MPTHDGAWVRGLPARRRAGVSDVRTADTPSCSAFRHPAEIAQIRRRQGLDAAGSLAARGAGTPFANPQPVPRQRRPVLRSAALLAALLAAPAGCDRDAQARPSPAEDPASSAAEVALRVKLAPVDTGVLGLEGAASGQLHAYRSATVSAEVAGRVVQRWVERGAGVEPGARLFRVDAKTSQLRYRQAKANEDAIAIDLELAARELERGDTLMKTQDIALSQYDQLSHSKKSATQRRELAQIDRKLARRSVADAKVKAPFGGTVVAVHAEVGDYVGPGSPLVTVADLSSMRLRVGVTAAEALELSRTPGRTVEVRFDDLGGATVEAVLHDVSPLADPRSGTYTAEFWLEQPPDQPLREGMVGRLQLADLHPSEALLIPRTAVTRHGGGFAVWVAVSEDGRLVARRREVTLGRYDNDRTEVRSGLKSDDRVVIDGLFALQDGAAIEVDGEHESLREEA